MYLRKTIGTLAIVSVLLGGSVSVFPSDALAAFIASRGSIITEGVVTSVGANSVTISTAGGPQTINTTDSTRVLGGDVAPGDSVRVIGRGEGNSVQARLIRNSGGPSGPGYGTSGSLLVTSGTVVSKTATTLVVDTEAGNTTIAITPSTRFVRKDLSELAPGDNVTITGSDTGVAFVARSVIGR